VLATLPETAQQDGTIAFDTHGGFGYALPASTGGSQTKGGTVYAIAASGAVRKVGSYPGPGGADNIELAPARFGSAANELLLAIDRRRHRRAREDDHDVAGPAAILLRLPHPAGQRRGPAFVALAARPGASARRGDATRSAPLGGAGARVPGTWPA
jgi:hypothetical protein